MSVVLIIGNGFDLYHRLPTRYRDFMFLVTEWDAFYDSYVSTADENTNKSMWKVHSYLDKDGSMTQEALKEFGTVLGDSRFGAKEHIVYLKRNLHINAWIQYFKSLKDDDLKWVDFEYEIQKVLSLTEEYFNETIPAFAEAAITSLFDSMDIIERIFGWAADTDNLPSDILNKYKYLNNSYQNYRSRISISRIIDRIELNRLEKFEVRAQRNGA